MIGVGDEDGEEGEGFEEVGPECEYGRINVVKIFQAGENRLEQNLDSFGSAEREVVRNKFNSRRSHRHCD